MTLPSKVKIVEVGPRDGLQNEHQPIESGTKVALIDNLSLAGLKYIEAGSFVNPKWIPQMAGSEDVFAKISRKPGVTYAALVPNLQGFERAMSAGVTEVAVFAAASEQFSQKNINCTIKESIERFKPIMRAAAEHQVAVRGYLSCVLGCPYQGKVSAVDVARVSEQLLEIGCYEVSLGDTIGVGTPGSVVTMLEAVTKVATSQKFAVHFHDTYGMAVANIYAALQAGIQVVDSSVSGLGGCPYAKGATGNVATEDVVYLLDGLGIEHGVNLQQLIRAGAQINQALGRASNSRVALASSRSI